MIKYNRNTEPVVTWDTLTSLGPVTAQAIGYPPEPEVGFPGGFALRHVKQGEKDILDVLPIEDAWELQSQAQEEWEAYGERVRLDLRGERA